MHQLLSHMKDRIGRRKGGRKPATQLNLVEGPSTVNDSSQSPDTHPNAAPRSSAHTADSEILSIPASSRPPVSKSPPIQTQLERRDEQVSNVSKLPKPYATNFDLWNEASSHPDGPGKHCDIKEFMGEPDRNSSDVKNLAEVIKEKLDEKFNPQEHDSSARRVIENAVAVLSKFTSAVDVAVSFDPVHAALPWAAVRSVLVFVTSSIELQSQILAGIAAVVSLLAQCDTYQQLYMAPDPNLRPPKTALHELKTAIVETFAKSQSFLSFVVQQQQSKIRQVAAPFKLSDAESHIKDLSKCEKQLARVAANCEKRCNLSSRSTIEGFMQLNATFHENIQNQIELLLDQINRNDQMETLNWISSVQYGKHHNRVKDDRTPKTCKWLLKHKRFHEWSRASSSMILWLQGSPGAGKTFLTSKVIDHIQASVERSPNQEGFAFFYCNRNEEARRKPLSVLQSYIRQLSTTIKKPGYIRKQLQDFCRETRLKGSDFGFSDCKKQLLESVNLYSQTTLVLDALDECEPHSRRQIFETVEYLLSESRNPLKVFISSRPDRDIRNRFRHRPNVEIQATNNEDDIQKFVNEEITKHENWGGMSPDLRDAIVKVLFARSQGMFQWAFLQIKQILLLETDSAIRDRLGKLPADLKTAYDEIYNKIQNHHKDDRALAENAFKWVACACEPLNSEQLLSAIRLNSDTENFTLLSSIDESQLLHLCNNLLVLDSKRHVWRFSHLSVTEYFENNHWSLSRAHCHAASVCLKFLIEAYKTPDIDKYLDYHSRRDRYIFTDSNADSDSNSNSDAYMDSHTSSDKLNWSDQPDKILGLVRPLEFYMRKYWIYHTETQEEEQADSTLKCLLKSFLGSPLESSLQYQQWYRIVSGRSARSIMTTKQEEVRLEEIAPESVALFAMCRFSFYNLLEEWWEEDTQFDITLTNIKKERLLGLAAEGGCKQNCKNLIKRGADVNHHIPGSFGSVLAVCKDIETMELLIQAGADVNMQLQHGNYGSALAAAAATAWHEIEVAKLLLDNGADVNMQLQYGYYGSALAAAAFDGAIEVTTLLINSGADVNMQLQHGIFGSALAAAAFHGAIEVTTLLINSGADVNMQLQHGNYGSALVAASAFKHSYSTVLELLVDAGADVDMQVQVGEYGNALSAAIARGSTKAEKFLVLHAKADVNQQVRHEKDDTALRAAIDFLIQAGAKVNLKVENASFRSASEASRGTLPVKVTFPE
ncbi:hypothetical protein F4680DRAFT_46657 [Xylaria scruposa]|nr:hypothetical protein F4680DRAFT_46657 [Xylaria scruposa]